MSQYDFGTINTAITSGVDLATLLQNWRNAVNSNHVGAARPTYVQTGMIWVNSTAQPYVVNYYDGAVDIPLGYINTIDDLASFLSRQTVLVKSASATIAVTERELIIAANATAAAITLTLPTCALAKNGFKITVLKSDNSANTVSIIRAGSDLLNGATTWVISNQFESSAFVSDGGANWFVIGSGLPPASVTLAKMAANSVDNSKIVNGTVGNAELASNSVDSSKIIDGQVGNAELASNAVTDIKILNDVITFLKIKSDQVATEAAAIAGLANNLFMTPLSTAQAIQSATSELLVDVSKPIYVHNSGFFAVFKNRTAGFANLRNITRKGGTGRCDVIIYNKKDRNGYSGMGNPLEIFPSGASQGGDSTNQIVVDDSGLVFTDQGYVYGAEPNICLITQVNVNNPTKKVKAISGTGKTTNVYNGIYQNDLHFIDATDILWSTGSNTYGQVCDGTTVQKYPGTRALASLGVNFQAVKGAWNFGITSLILGNDNRLYSVGYRGIGTAGNGAAPAANYLYPTLIAELPDVSTKGGIKRVFSVGAYNRSNVFVHFNNDELWGAGTNASGILGRGNTTLLNTYTLLASNVTDCWESSQHDIDTHVTHGLWIRQAGVIKYAGSNNQYVGMNGTNTVNNVFTTCSDAAFTGRTVVNIWSVNGYYQASSSAFVLFTDNTLFAIGNNSLGGLGLNSVTSPTTLTRVNNTNEFPFPADEISWIGGINGVSTWYGAPTIIARANGEVYVSGSRTEAALFQTLRFEKVNLFIT